MASRRMLSRDITESDAFLEMPLSAQALYMHLNQNADDDGFVNSPKRIARMIGASEDDLKLLIAKRFILTFESGIIVIKHWKINNYIRSDRYKETAHLEEKAMLETKKNGAYTLGIPLVNHLDTQTRTGQDRIVKNNSCSSGNGSFSQVLSDEEWNLLDRTFYNLLDLIDLCDDSVHDLDSVKNPYKYVVTVANAKNWERKRIR